MSEQSEAIADGIDFAVAYREAGGGEVEPLVEDKVEDLDSLAAGCAAGPGRRVAGLLSVDEDFFLIVRVLGAETRSCSPTSPPPPTGRSRARRWSTSVRPRPTTRTTRCPRATSASSPTWAWAPWTWARCSTSTSLYPDEMLGDIATCLGFGAQFEEAVGVAAP